MSTSGAPAPASWLRRHGPLAAAAVLRLASLDRQIIIGDEVHAIIVANEARSLWEILTTYRPSDHSIPLTALYRLLMDLGIVLDERAFRLPIVLAGLLLVW